MKYKVTPRPTDHRLDLTAEDVETAIREWVERNATVEIPEGVRLHLSRYDDHGHGSEVTGYMAWDSDDIEVNPTNERE